MNKNVFARDRAAVDAEIERLKPLVDPWRLHSVPDIVSHRMQNGIWFGAIGDRMREEFRLNVRRFASPGLIGHKCFIHQEKLYQTRNHTVFPVSC